MNDDERLQAIKMSACDHGQGQDRRCVTECFGASSEGPLTMISRCMLCARGLYETSGVE
jgi:hypothetical protein